MSRSKSEIFKIALDNVNDCIFMSTVDGELLYANKQFREEYGLSDDKKDVMVYDLPLSVRTSEAFSAMVQRLRDNKGSLLYNANHLSPSSNSLRTRQVSVTLIEMEDQKDAIWFIMRDITDLLQSRDESRELSRLLNAVLDNLPLYLFVKDVEDDFRYLYWNKAFADYSKIPASKVIGRTDFEVFPDYNDALKFRKDDMEVFATGEPIDRHETYEAADGSTRIVQTQKMLVPREGRGPLLIGVSWDITNMQNIEKELVEERLQAEKSDRLKTAFLANMSHEIRTPLNAIVGFSDLLTHTHDDEQKRMFSHVIKQNSDLLLQLINDILDLSKIEAGTLEYMRSPVDLSELFRNAYASVKNRVQEGVEFTLEMDNEKHDVIVNEDRNRLTQVVTNLLTNAIKFTTKGQIKIGYKIKGEWIEAYVQDSGIGIPKDQQERIFDRFVKLDKFSQGTGLGLPICKVIVNTMGGDLWVESTLGEGSTFKFTIPYKNEWQRKLFEKAKNNKEKEATPTTINVAKKDDHVILMAEDVYSNFLLVKSMIGKKYKLLWAQDGADAVQMYKEQKPSLVLMDIKMPRMDGLEATKIIRSYSKDVPIVALSAFAFDADRKKAFDAGVDEYLTKPIAFEALAPILEKYLGF